MRIARRMSKVESQSQFGNGKNRSRSVSLSSPRLLTILLVSTLLCARIRARATSPTTENEHLYTRENEPVHMTSRSTGPSKGPTLPAGWATSETGAGFIYFFHKDGRVQWERPGGAFDLEPILNPEAAYNAASPSSLPSSAPHQVSSVAIGDDAQPQPAVTSNDSDTGLTMGWATRVRRESLEAQVAAVEAVITAATESVAAVSEASGGGGGGGPPLPAAPLTSVTDANTTAAVDLPPSPAPLTTDAVHTAAATRTARTDLPPPSPTATAHRTLNRSYAAHRRPSLAESISARLRRPSRTTPPPSPTVSPIVQPYTSPAHLFLPRTPPPYAALYAVGAVEAVPSTFSSSPSSSSSSSSSTTSSSAYSSPSSVLTTASQLQRREHDRHPSKIDSRVLSRRIKAERDKETKAAFALRQTRMSVASRQRREEMAHTRRAASSEKEREMLDRRARYDEEMELRERTAANVKRDQRFLQMKANKQVSLRFLRNFRGDTAETRSICNIMLRCRPLTHAHTATHTQLQRREQNAQRGRQRETQAREKEAEVQAKFHDYHATRTSRDASHHKAKRRSWARLSIDAKIWGSNLRA